jgi:hypothetical protein
LLAKFCETWAKQTPPKTTEEIDRLPDSLREIYRLYYEFYDPGNPLPTTESFVSGQLYDAMKYCIIQDEIPYAIVDTFFQDSLMEKEFQRVASELGISVDSVKRGFIQVDKIQAKLNVDWPRAYKGHVLTNFRPQIRLPNRQTLIVTPEYEKLLNQFLTKHGMSCLKFLSTQLTITDFHGRDSWALLTKPVVFSIIMDRSLNKAVVTSFITSFGACAYYAKVNGQWTLMGSQMTIYN